MVKWMIKWGLRDSRLSHGELSSRILERAIGAFSTQILKQDWELNPPFSLIHFILCFCQQNSKVSSRTTVVPDIPGFRKILPRSDYIIIPKTTLQEDRSRQSLELHVTQGQAAPEGTASTNITNISHDAVQNVLSVDSSHVGISEQCIAIERLSEESASFGQSEAVEEVVASEVLSHCTGPVTDKVAGDVLLDEASLEIEGQPYQTTQVVIEETLVSGSADISSGSIAVARPQVSDGVSVVTVVTGRVSYSSNAPNPVRFSPELSDCCLSCFTWDFWWLQEVLYCSVLCQGAAFLTQCLLHLCLQVLCHHSYLEMIGQRLIFLITHYFNSTWGGFHSCTSRFWGEEIHYLWALESCFLGCREKGVHLIWNVRDLLQKTLFCEVLHLLISTVSRCKELDNPQSRQGKAVAFEMVSLFSCFLVS